MPTCPEALSLELGIGEAAQLGAEEVLARLG